MQSLQADQSLYNRKGVCYIVQLSVFRRSRNSCSGRKDKHFS